MKFRGILALIFALSGFVASAEPGPPIIEVIGVAANTNRSSGGHSALRIGKQVYQYQVADDKMLFLQRDPWPFFEHRYRKLDNRSLTLVQLDLNSKDAQKINSRLNRLFVVQEKYLARWKAMKIEQLWFENLSGGNPSVSIPIVGCFDFSSRNDERTRQLQISAGKILGRDFINQELKLVTEILKNTVLETSSCSKGEIEIDAYPGVSEIAAERRLEQLTLREALMILKQARGISPALLIAPDESTLSESDRSQLKRLALTFKNAVQRLLTSSRPDRGEALLINIARYSAIRHSLQQNRLLLLNVFPTDEKATTLLDARETVRHRKLLIALSNQAGEVWRKERQLFMNVQEPLTEYGYQRMENAAARFIEPRDAIRDGRALLTCTSGFLRPDREGFITPYKIDPLTVKSLSAAQQQSKSSYAIYLSDLRSVYGYSLFLHNCTTALAKAIQSTFANEKEIHTGLGAVIDPTQGLTLIPAAFTRKVQRRWRIVDTRVLPSHRLEQSARLTAQVLTPWIALRESNRLTSTVYPGSVHDDAFLFFSDGSSAWRPMQGAANLLYGLTNTGVGMVTAPTENGRLRVKLGLSGMFYSVPEMIGISIRKGRYDILPRNESGEP